MQFPSTSNTCHNCHLHHPHTASSQSTSACIVVLGTVVVFGVAVVVLVVIVDTLLHLAKSLQATVILGFSRLPTYDLQCNREIKE